MGVLERVAVPGEADTGRVARAQPRRRPRRSGAVAGLREAVVSDLDADAREPLADVLRADQARPLDQPRAARPCRPWILDAGARRRVGRARGPDARRRVLPRPEHRLYAPPVRRGAVAAHQGASDLGATPVLQRPPGVGVDRATVRRAPRVRAAPLDRRADRTRAARDRRRRVGEADVGRPEPHRRGSPVARQPRRDRHAVVSARARPRDRAGVAVLRAADRRDPAAARRHDPLATADRAGRRAGVSARRADQQDRDRVHQAGRPDRRRRDRPVGAGPACAPEVHRPQDRRAGRHAVLLPRSRS